MLPRFVNILTNDEIIPDPDNIIQDFYQTLHKETLEKNYEKNKTLYRWDTNKIYIGPYEKDYLMQSNVFNGKIISNFIYPLIYENECDVPEINYRSLDFYNKVLNDPTLYTKLSSYYKTYFAVGIRDLFVASDMNILTDNEKKILKEIINIIDEDIIICTINGLNVTPYPSASNLMSRYIEDVNFGDPVIEQYFVKNNLGLTLVFVNPEELSYHNFENIINLDNLFINQKPKQDDLCNKVIDGQNISDLYTNFNISEVSKKDDDDIFTFRLEGTTETLLKLDKLNLYNLPLNKSSRGGKRFIFMSKTLSKSLYESINKCDHFSKKFKNNFKLVNSVFRYNKFSPSDDKFKSHYDTPYFDSKKNYYSKYTLLLYLTGGHGERLLDIENRFVLNEIKEFTGVIFNQKYEHEGNPYFNSEKIFIRSELIYYYDKIERDDDVAKIFNISCYLTKQSFFNKKVEKFINESFNHVSKLRHKISSYSDSNYKEVLFHKSYEKINFITNGNDYWFLNNIDLTYIGIMIILDYFNGIYNNKHFNKSTSSQIIEFDLPTCNDKYLYLLKNLHISAIDNDVKIKSLYDTNIKFETLTDITSDEHCCDFHYGRFDPSKCNDIIYLYNNIMKDSIDKTDDFSVIIMDNQIRIRLDDIQVTDNKIYFKNTGIFKRVNFAACWNSDYHPKNYIDYETKNITGFSLPPINYTKENKCYHLSIDMFNNNLIIPQRKKIVIPRFIDDPKSESDDDSDNNSDDDSDIKSSDDEGKNDTIITDEDNDNEDDNNKNRHVRKDDGNLHYMNTGYNDYWKESLNTAVKTILKIKKKNA